MYDNNGNIVKKREFAKVSLKDGLLLEEEDSKDTVYVYEGDRLVSYGGADFVYDVMGKPTTYRGKAAKWEKGRNLVSYGGHTFAYDGQGRRIAKDGISFAYDSNGNLIKQSNGLEYIYDHSGVFGVTYGGETYVYRKDAQGNVIALMNASGAVVARYLYDAWGTCVVVNNGGTEISDANHIGNLNPFRYRGYYYDVETKLYYRKTRYYDPEVGRFMTIDGMEYLDPETINGLNLYAYCGNNPVMAVDPNGNKWWRWLLGAVIIIAAVALSVVTAGVAASISAALGGGMLGAIAGGAIAGAITSFGIGVAVQGISNGITDVKSILKNFKGIPKISIFGNEGKKNDKFQKMVIRIRCGRDDRGDGSRGGGLQKRRGHTARFFTRYRGSKQFIRNVLFIGREEHGNSGYRERSAADEEPGR